MNDTRATRPRSAPARRARPDGPLGELEFADWYETPVFEPDEEERLEEMATMGHGPRRLMAKATLAREARRAKRRLKPQPSAPAPAEPAPAATRTPTPAPAPTAPVVTRTPTPAPAPTAPVVTRAPAPAEELAPTAPAPAKRLLDLEDLAGDPGSPHDRWSSWATDGPALDDESMQRDLDRENWRRRVNSFLDRWAETEVSVAARLDRSLEKVLDPSLPKSLPGLLAAARRGGSH